MTISEPCAPNIRTSRTQGQQRLGRTSCQINPDFVCGEVDHESVAKHEDVSVLHAAACDVIEQHKICVINVKQARFLLSLDTEVMCEGRE